LQQALGHPSIPLEQNIMVRNDKNNGYSQDALPTAQQNETF